jgi:hypothetical protein
METFFSDQKSQGFHFPKRHLAAPARLSRLLIAVVWLASGGSLKACASLQKVGCPGLTAQMVVLKVSFVWDRIGSRML